MATAHLIFYDIPFRESLLPLTFTRPASELRVGILTIREKWEYFLGQNSSFLTAAYLRKKYPCRSEPVNWLINATVCPVKPLAEQVANLGKGESLWTGDLFIAANIAGEDLDRFSVSWAREHTNCHNTSLPYNQIQYPWHIFSRNEDEINSDFGLITNDRSSQEPGENNVVTGNHEKLFIEPGARVNNASLNTTSGPVYIGRDAEVMEGSTIRGPFALCEHGVVKMQAKIYGASTVGPWSKVGGELTNSVIQGYSNKAHDGFLGNAVLGEWCNLGADTNNSNLKNNYAEIKLWNYNEGRFINTGKQFCGLFMGDHSKCGINTMFNTGTVVGVSANIFGTGFPRNFIPSFSWGGASKMSVYKLEKAFEVAEKVMSRRNVAFTAEDEQILTHIFEHTAQYRKFK